MKSIMKGVLITVLSVGIMSQSAFAFTNGQWLNIDTYETRKAYNVDRDEASKYLVKLYRDMGGKEVAINKNDFDDINNKTHPDAMQAYYLGIIRAYGLREFAPKAAMTYDELVLDIYRMVKRLYPRIESGYGELEEKLSAKDFVVSRGIIPIAKAVGKSKVTLEELSEVLDNTRNAAPNFEIKTDTSRIDWNIPEGPKAYLTFDDDVSYLTPLILDTLKKYDVKATFFIAGHGNKDIIKRIADEGHTVAVHTYTHDYSKIYQSSEAFWEDIETESNYLADILGYKPTLFRFPGGSNNTVSLRYGGKDIMSRLKAEVEEKGYIYFDWNNDSGDASGKKYSPDQIAENVLGYTGKNESLVVLMHQTASKASTYKALPKIIEGLRAKGYTLLPLTEVTPVVQFK